MAINAYEVISETVIPLSKVEKALLHREVKDVRYTQCTPRTIFCVVVANDGHEVFGTSSCRDLANFSEELGKAYALRYALGRLFRRPNDLVD